MKFFLDYFSSVMSRWICRSKYCAGSFHVFRVPSYRLKGEGKMLDTSLILAVCLDCSTTLLTLPMVKKKPGGRKMSILP